MDIKREQHTHTHIHTVSIIDDDDDDHFVRVVEEKKAGIILNIAQVKPTFFFLIALMTIV